MTQTEFRNTWKMIRSFLWQNTPTIGLFVLALVGMIHPKTAEGLAALNAGIAVLKAFLDYVTHPSKPTV